jgi:hypothetical protein
MESKPTMFAKINEKVLIFADQHHLANTLNQSFVKIMPCPLLIAF